MRLYNIWSRGSDDPQIDASGVFFKFGYKLIRTPDYYLKGMKYAHILKGSYIKPEIALSSFSYETGRSTD
ncbi:MAG: hypothetical protein U5K51_09125 [Flavobacteriaceae bacterium]|nr:hypothetical protein [Flavobacteriaceae bacterium]